MTLALSSGCSASKPAALASAPDDATAGKLDAPLADAARPVSAAVRACAGSEREVASFHILGRVDMRDPAGPRLGWPGTRLRARFFGPGLSLDLADTGTSHYDVSIDGGPPERLIVSGTARTYEVATGLTPGEHDIIVTKRTETLMGVTQLLGVVAQAGGALVPTLVPDGRRMEIIGDSITCGFGVLGADETCPFDAETECEPASWGALAAARLSAIHTTIAVSGIGMFRNYGGETERTMPELYGRSIANDPSSAWDHSFVPDVIVVSLATNDFVGKGDPGPAFREKYTTFLATLRATHPKARIVAATSPMLGEPNRTAHRAQILAAIGARIEAGDRSVTLLDLDEQSRADGLGCGHHPSQTTHQKMAAKLVAHLRPLMGW